MDHVTGFSRQPHEAAIIILPVLALTGRGRWIGRGDLRLREVQLLAPPHKLVNRRSQNPPPPYAADVPVSPCLPILSPSPTSPAAALGSSRPVWSLDTGHSPERRCSHGWQDLLRGLELPRASHLPGKMDGDRLGAENFAKEG